jgi:hypothetical protein
LIYRRAEFVYNACRLAAIAANAPVVPPIFEKRHEDFKSQFLDVIEQQCGPNRKSSPEELHDDWVQAYLRMGWVYGPNYSVENKTHPDMVSYFQLNQLEQDKDSVFIEMCEIARKWIR